MNIKTFTIVCFTIALITLSSCITRRMIKQAEEMEQAGLYREAAGIYYEALQRGRTNVDAISGLRRTGEFTLNRKLSGFSKAYSEQNNEEAVMQYLSAKSYYEKLKSVNVFLNFPSHYHTQYNEVKDLYLDDKYFQGINYLENENFTNAERIFREIIEIQPNYRDVKAQLNIAIYEPIYRESLLLMDNRKYREAYNLLGRIINNLGTYKDAHDLRRESLEKGRFTISLAPIKASSSVNRTIQSRVENDILKKLQLLDNPFLRLVDYNKANTESGQSSIRFTAPDATLFCEIISFNYQAGRLRESTERAYLKKRVRYKNPETERIEYKTEYEKVSYQVYRMSRGVSITISYRLINERNGEILNSGSNSFSASDNIHYARYDGNHENLVPGYWKSRRSDSDEDVIRDNRRDVRELQALFNSRTKIKSYDYLSEDLFNRTSDFVAVNINSYVLSN